jgi:hypothetical protein
MMKSLNFNNEYKGYMHTVISRFVFVAFVLAAASARAAQALPVVLEVDAKDVTQGIQHAAFVAAGRRFLPIDFATRHRGKSCELSAVPC